MEYYSAQGTIAGERLSFNFYFEDTVNYYRSWLTPVEPNSDGITVPWSDFEDRYHRWNMPPDAFTEYDLSMYRACDALIPKGKCVFHGAAFLWNNAAFILIGPSGIGKSTQLNHWKSLWETEIQVMNGDKPILHHMEDGRISVLPSPWRGKERWGNDALSAPLGGLILLEQGKENRINRLYRTDLPCFFLRSVFASFEKKETIYGACRIVDGVLRSVPVWKLVNTGDAAAAVLTRETLLKERVFDAL